MDMKILIACEESQEVCKAFRERGFEAYSCDIQDCSGGHPEWHIKDDVLKHLDEHWDLIIAHPPCTYLSNCGTRWFSLRVSSPESVAQRWDLRCKALSFFLQIWASDCKHIAIENPVGYMSTAFREPDQYIQPYYWAVSCDDENYYSKKTGLWLKNLPCLVSNGIFNAFDNAAIYGKYSSGKNKTWEDTRKGQRSSVRSKTPPGIARAMAQQWGDYLLKGDNI